MAGGQVLNLPILLILPNFLNLLNLPMNHTLANPGEALHHLLEIDLLHQKNYGTHADQSLISRIILTAFEAYIRGDKTVDV